MRTGPEGSRPREDADYDARREEILARRYAKTGDMLAREELAERLMPLVRRLAQRYAGRGVQLEDLVQAGSIGLLKAIDRYDPDSGNRLAGFAIPNVTGEIKRHFRDQGWAMRVPRDLKDLGTRVIAAQDVLRTRLGREPRVSEIAEELGAETGDVLDALHASRAHHAMSLDEPFTDSGRTVTEVVGAEDGGFERAEQRPVLGDGLRHLQKREREVVQLRFGAGLTQREIGERIGISQMHVSRLLASSLRTLRETVGEDLDASDFLSEVAS